MCSGLLGEGIAPLIHHVFEAKTSELEIHGAFGNPQVAGHGSHVAPALARSAGRKGTRSKNGLDACASKPLFCLEFWLPDLGSNQGPTD